MARRFRSRRGAIVASLLGSWLVITVLEFLVDPPEWFDVLLWVAIFGLTAFASAAAVAEILVVLKRIRRRRVPPELLLPQKVIEVRTRGYLREEALRFLISVCAIGVGVVIVLQVENLSVPLFFGMALGILGNTLFGREDRREQKFLVEEADGGSKG